MAKFKMELSITGIQEVQAANARMMAELQPSGALGRAVQYGTIAAHRAAIAITHVDTGTLRAAHRMDVQKLAGRVYIDPGAINPRTHQYAAVYGVTEQKRGGEHAFYRRVVDERGETIRREMARIMRDGVA